MHTGIPQQSKVIASANSWAFPDIPPRPLYFTVAQFSERNPAFSQSALRNLVFKADARESTRGTIPGNGLIRVRGDCANRKKSPDSRRTVLRVGRSSRGRKMSAPEVRKAAAGGQAAFLKASHDNAKSTAGRGIRQRMKRVITPALGGRAGRVT